MSLLLKNTCKMEKGREKTPVTFYLETGNGTDDETPFAFFPEMYYWDKYAAKTLKTSYSHIGQHSACDDSYVKDKALAKPEQYLPLLYELEGRGYRLSVLNPFSVCIKSNQYGFPCQTYYYLVNHKGETYHHYDNKWRKHPLKQINTYWFKTMGEAQEMLNTLMHKTEN